MALRFGSTKSFKHLGIGFLFGAIGKTIFDRFHGSIDGNELTIGCEEFGVKYGIPRKTAVLKNENFIVGYNSARKIPDWVYQNLSYGRLNGQAKRERCIFKEDPRVPKMFSSSEVDYHKSGFSRGHMASAGDNKANQQMMNETFYYTNIAPQNTDNNKGIWYKIECYCRKLAEKYSNVFVLSGPLFIPEKDLKNGKKFMKYQVIGPSEVAVPTHFYKIIVVEKDEVPLAIGTFVVPNKQLSTEKQLDQFSYPLSFVEEKLGYVIFPKLERQNLESLCSVESCDLNVGKVVNKNVIF